MTYEVKRGSPIGPPKRVAETEWKVWFGPGYTEEQEAAIDADKTG